MIKVLGLVLSSVLVIYANSSELIAKKSDEVTDGFISSISSMKMTLIDANSQKVVREMQSKTFEGDNGDKSLMIFLTPADVKGTKMLTHERLHKDDNQWIYLPALKRVKRIASKNKSGSFMGSEFSYEDIANENYKSFIYNDDLEVVSLDNKEYYKSSRIPKDKNSGYTKQITWIDKDSYLVYKVDYYDRKNELLKTAIFGDYKNINGVYRIGSISMKNYQNSKSTILEWIDDKIDVGLKDRDFSKRVLKSR